MRPTKPYNICPAPAWILRCSRRRVGSRTHAHLYRVGLKPHPTKPHKLNPLEPAWIMPHRSMLECFSIGLGEFNFQLLY